MNMLEKAITIAVKAHKGQLDKTGHPLILHPLRLMFRMSNEKEMIVAVLHDVVEDSHVKLDELRYEGFAEEIIDAVDCLTWRERESYDTFIKRVGRNILARKVKCADLEDNMNVLRLKQLSEEDVKRLRKYHRAWNLLTKTQDKSNSSIDETE